MPENSTRTGVWEAVLSADDRAQKRSESVSVALFGERFEAPLLTADNVFAKGSVRAEPVQLIGDHPEILRLNEQSAVCEGFGHSGALECKNRDVELHRLQQWNTEAFVLRKTEERVCDSVISDERS